MTFKLQSNITRVKLFMHHNYFEWAPCIETWLFCKVCALLLSKPCKTIIEIDCMQYTYLYSFGCSLVLNFSISPGLL